jgi:AhpD family alkylhydroperoxidase
MSQSHSDRINLGKAAPELYQALIALDRQVSERVQAAGIDAGFSHLLRLRASQINGCSFCVRMHGRDAASKGETADRVYVLTAWRESDYFNEKERAALALTEAVTLIAEGQVPDAVYAEAAKTLSNEEIAAIEWLAIMIGTWNRVAIASRYPVHP